MLGRAALGALVLTCAAGAALSAQAQAQWQVGAYLGNTATHGSDLDYSSPGRPDRTFSVEWDGRGFEGPVYYGYRARRWFERDPRWAIQYDFNHIKTYADLDGAVGGTFTTLNFSHGLNIATLDVVHRTRADGGPTPYFGAGIGVSVPHVEVDGPQLPRTHEYQVGGPAVAGFVGYELPLGERLSAFAEYKLSYTSVEAELNGGGSLSTGLLNHHANVGLLFRFSAF